MMQVRCVGNGIAIEMKRQIEKSKYAWFNREVTLEENHRQTNYCDKILNNYQEGSISKY